MEKFINRYYASAIGHSFLRKIIELQDATIEKHSFSDAPKTIPMLLSDKVMITAMSMMTAPFMFVH